MKLSKPLSRFLIASATVAASTGVLIGGIKLYSIHNELGVYPIQIKDKVSDFVAKKDQISEAEFVNTKGEKVAHFDVEALTDKSIKEPIVLEDNIKSNKRRFSISEFEKWFGKNYNRQTPIFNVRVGVMNFVNEYWDALEPQEFLEYALWFIHNVSWGPDAITLQHFALKKGVTRQGNNLLLGQHSGVRKEETKIEFYPDSFFGSFPIFSTLSGKGNALDKLTYKIFSKPISKASLDEYLETIPQKQVLANWNKKDNLAGLAGISLLNGQKVYKYNLIQLLAEAAGISDFSDSNNLIAQKLLKASREGQYDFVVFDHPGQDIEQVKHKFQAAALLAANDLNLQLPSNYSFKFDKLQLQPKIISSAQIRRGIDKYTTNTGDDNFPQGVLELSFQQETESPLNLYLMHSFSASTMTLEIAELASSIKAKVDEIVKNGFYDLYNIHQGDGKQIGLYEPTNTGEISFFAIDNRWNPSPSSYAQYEYLSNFNSDFWSVWTIRSLNKVSPTLLEVNLEKTDNSTDSANKTVQTRKITFDLDPKKTDYQKQLREFSYFKQAIDWFDRSTPRIIQEVDQLVNGKNETYYELYADVYDGLIDTVLRNKPLTGEQLQGTYLTKIVDPKSGMLSYSSIKGEYIGFSPTSRISYISLLKASSPFFKTTGINYLKYVGTHEYGHHQTLTYAQDNSDPSTNVILNALSTITQPQVQSFYNLKTLQLYLDARSSGLKIRRSDPDLNSSLTGVFPNFSYKKGGKNSYETEKEIYGSKQNQDIGVLLADPSRRFLQSFSGLEKAAQLRDLKLYDLFLLNSFDTESGTINPSTEDKAEYFRQSQKLLNQIVPGSVADNTQSTTENKELSSFISGSDIQDLYSNSITDGKGNKIQFDANRRPIIATYKVNPDRTTFSDLDVKVFYPNGRPVIDVKTFKQPNSLAELTSAISEVQRNFLNQLVVKFSDNGWNGSSNNNTNNVEKFKVSNPYWSGILTELLTNPVEKQALLNNDLNNNRVTFELSNRLVNNIDIKTLLLDKNNEIDPSIKSELVKLIEQDDNKKMIEALNGELNKVWIQASSTSNFATSNVDLYDQLKNIGNLKNAFYQKISDAIFEGLLKYTKVFDEKIKGLDFSKLLDAKTQESKLTPKTEVNKSGQASEQNFKSIILTELVNLFRSKLYQQVANKLDNLLTFKVYGEVKQAPNLLGQLKKDILVAGNAGNTADEYFKEAFRFHNSVEFGSTPYAKIIKVGENSYYQNPKYDFFVNMNKLDQNGQYINSGAIATITDNSEIDPTSYDKPIHKSSLATLLKLDQLSDSNKLFGIAQDFSFGKTSSAISSSSKIYLDAWDSDLFGFDYQHNYFVKNGQDTSFDTIAAFLDFISIDPFNMVIEKKDDDYIRNWNLDYTMTKFDLFSYAFDQLNKDNKSQITKPNNKVQDSTALIDTLSSIFKIDKSEIRTKVQDFANTLMNAFEQSTLNVLFKNPNIDDKNIDPLFLSSVGFKGFTTYKGNPSENPSGLFTKFGLFNANLPKEKTEYKKLAFRYRAISDVNSVSFASEAFVGDDLNHSSKSQVLDWIKDFLKENHIGYNGISLYMLQHIVGSKNYYYPNLTQPIVYTRSDIELTNLRNKNQSRSESRPDDYFTNYVYNFPESLTRDFVQIHYVPSQKNLDNIPSAFANISENNTGNEYFVDGNLTKRWYRSYMPIFDISQGRNQTAITPFTNFYLTSLIAGLKTEKLNHLYNELEGIFEKSQKNNAYSRISDLLEKRAKELSSITSDYTGTKFIDKVLADNKVQEKQKQIIQKYKNQIDEISGPIGINLQSAIEEFQGELQNWHHYYDKTISAFISNGYWRTGYIGQNNSTNNGFFKDRFQRKVLGWELYDENREPVKDDTLSITNLKGKRVTNRPEAYWYYLLKSEGVGETTVSGIWRDSKRDQVVLWGFVKKDQADKIKYLTFEDETGKTFSISVSTKNNDNLFYLKRQADPTTKHTLEDEGYTSWMTSWSIIGDFKNALLRPTEAGSREFRVYFSDENHKEIKDLLDLGHYEFVAENGKNYNTAPTFLTKKGEQTYFVVRTQFS